MIGLVTEFLWLLTKGFKAGLKLVLPFSWRRNLRRWLKSDSENPIIESSFINKWEQARLLSDPDAKNKFAPGVNVVGYFRSTIGLGEAARSSVSALKAEKIPFCTIDFEHGIPKDMLVDGSFSGSFSNTFNYKANLIHVNAELLPYLWRTYPQEYLVGRYNIGVWYWEMMEFPQRWRNRYRVLDELWAATTFIQNSLQSSAPFPVIHIPPCIGVRVDSNLHRADFGLPEDQFLFLCAYDTFSVQERKNPRAVIEGYKKAFSKTNKDVGLVIKINNSIDQETQIRALKEELKTYPNCYFIEEVMPKVRFSSLINLVDAYISLHRSEGFGLIPAEAMYLGKPVIVTNWSGNTDFTKEDNSCLVNYKLVQVGKGNGPYNSRQMWAEADVDHAVAYMQRLLSDSEYYQRIAARGKEFIRTHYSCEATGRLIKSRLQILQLI